MVGLVELVGMANRPAICCKAALSRSRLVSWARRILLSTSQQQDGVLQRRGAGGDSRTFDNLEMGGE